MSGDIRVIQYGLGYVGRAIARHVVEREGIELVGGVDTDPAAVGRDIGDAIGLGHPLGRAVSAGLAEALQDTPADVALHATASHFDSFKPQIMETLEAGLDIVSTAEELSFPWLTHPREAAEIDSVAKRADRTVLGTGINPGYVMDSLPLSLTAVCQRVDHIAVTRVIDASARRKPFQAKIGLGMSVEDFETQMAAGRFGHVGLLESMNMVFHTLGRELGRYETSVEPLVAERSLETDFFQVQPGQVRGLRQVAAGHENGGEFVSLTFIAGLDVEDEGDIIQITGKPDLEVKVKGTNGDIATIAIVVNAIRRVREAGPGLVTMRDLPIVTVW